MLSDWGLMKDKDGLMLNYYGPSTLTAKIKPGLSVTLAQETTYPLDGNITIKVTPSKTSSFTIKLRIPHWSNQTDVKLNGKAIPGVISGCYLEINRKWKAGDQIEVTLDMSLHFWQGAQACEGLASIYRGPVLLAYDHRYNLNQAKKGNLVVRDTAKWDPVTCMLDMPIIDAKRIKAKVVQWSDWLPPLLLLECKTKKGGAIHLCDFGSAGEAGTPYISWLPVDNSPDVSGFSRENPLRSDRI
jgi:DUF1680 family protein